MKKHSYINYFENFFLFFKIEIDIRDIQPQNNNKYIIILKLKLQAIQKTTFKYKFQ